MRKSAKINYSGINKSFSGLQLINDISISLYGGQSIILGGDNGTGKTTLLRILAGLEKPDSGYVNFGCSDVSWKHARKRLLENVMYLHQRPYMFSGSVYRNLALAVPRSLTAASTADQVNLAMQWGKLSRHEFTAAKKLSGGQQQRIALARAWLRQSPVLLLDEPVANMDTQSVARTIKLLHQLKNGGTSLLICSHNHQIFDSLCDTHIELVNKSLVDTKKRKYGGNITSINKERTHDNATG